MHIPTWYSLHRNLFEWHPNLDFLSLLGGVGSNPIAAINYFATRCIQHMQSHMTQILQKHLVSMLVYANQFSVCNIDIYDTLEEITCQ